MQIFTLGLLALSLGLAPPSALAEGETQTVVIHAKQAKLVSRTARVHAEPNVQSRLLYLAKQEDTLWVAPEPKDGWYRAEVPGYPMYGYIEELEVMLAESAAPELEPEASFAVKRPVKPMLKGFQNEWGVLVTGGAQFLWPRNYTGTIVDGIYVQDKRVSHLGYFIEPSVWTPARVGIAIQLGWFGLEDDVTGYNARATIVSPLLTYQIISKPHFALEIGVGSLYLAGANFTTQVTGLIPQESKGHYGVAGWQTRVLLRGAADQPLNGYLELGFKRMRRENVSTQGGFKFTWDLSTLYAGLGFGFRL
jgi:hypothetical protein